MTSCGGGLAAQHCAECGASFGCGAAASTPCWCTRLPALPAAAIEPGAGCLCEACLRRRIDEHAAAAPARSD